MRTTRLLCAYRRTLTYRSGDPGSGTFKVIDHDIYLLYANDSVVHFTFGAWEGAVFYDDDRTLIANLERTVAALHCDPDRYDQEIDVQWFTGAALVWRGRYYTKAGITNNGTLLIVDGERYTRVKCWDRIVLPPKWNSTRSDPCNDG